MANRHISLPKVFAEGDAKEWFQQFEICCTANEWSLETKALKLPTLLEGEALAVWLELDEADKKDYAVAKRKMLAKMAPVGFVSLTEFHARTLRPGEALSVFMHELKKLLGQAMVDLDATTRDKLLMHQLLSGLPPAISRQLRATGDVDNLEKMVERAKLLMTIDSEQQEQAAAVESGSTLESLRQQITGLSEQVAALTTRPAAKQPVCYRCHKPGHIQRNCPGLFQAQTCYACGSKGHIARNCDQLSGNDRVAPVKGRGCPRNQ